MTQKDLDEIEVESANLVRLLSDRHPGLMTWNDALADQMKTVLTLLAVGLYPVGLVGLAVRDTYKTPPA